MPGLLNACLLSHLPSLTQVLDDLDSSFKVLSSGSNNGFKIINRNLLTLTQPDFKIKITGFPHPTKLESMSQLTSLPPKTAPALFNLIPYFNFKDNTKNAMSTRREIRQKGKNKKM